MIAEINISANSEAAVQAVNRLEESYKKLNAEMMGGMVKIEKAAEKSGNSWTELSSKLSLIGTLASKAFGSLDDLENRLIRGSKLSQQIARIGADDLEQLRQMTGDIIAPDKIIAMETLFRKYNITTEQTGNVLKGIIAIAREQGKDASELAGNITEGIISGSRDVLENYGIMVETMTDKDKQRVAILDQFKVKYGEMNVAAESFADKEAQRQNQRAIQDANNLEALGENVNYWKRAKEHLLDVRDYTLSFIMTGNWPVENALNSFNKKWSDQYDIVARIRQDIEKTGTQFKHNANAFEQYMTGQKIANKATEEDLKLNRKLVVELEKQLNILDIRNNYASNHNQLTREMEKEANRARAELVKQKNVLQEMVINSDAFKNAFASLGQKILPAITNVMQTLNPLNWEAAKAAKATKQATDEQLLNYQLMLIARGANIDISGKLLTLLNKQTFEQMKINENEKALAFNKSLTEKFTRRETEELEKATPQYELQGKFLIEKLRLEAAHNAELKKKNDIDKNLDVLFDSKVAMESLKKVTAWQEKFRQNIQIEQQGYQPFTGLIQNHKTLAQLEEAKLRRDTALALGQKNLAEQYQKQISNIQQLSYAEVNKNLEMKVTEDRLNNLKTVYGSLADSERLQMDRQKAQIELQLAKNAGDLAAMQIAAQKITTLQAEAEKMGQVNLKLQEWSKNSYGFAGGLQTAFKQSANVLFMTDAQLKASGKSRTQLFKQQTKDVLNQIALENWGKGGTKTAEGFGALANPVTAPLAPGYFKAGLAHFAVATALGMAGRFAFGGGGGSAEAPKAAAEPVKTQVATNQTQVTNINITAGAIVNQDDMVRSFGMAKRYMEQRGWES